MTKVVFSLLSVLIFSFNSFSAEETNLTSVSCSAYASLPGSFVNLNCNEGNCTGWINANSFSFSGNCSDNIHFSAAGTTNSTLVSGFCNGGWVSINAPSENIYLRGNCSNGGSFSGNTFTQGGFASGSCKPNGMSSMYINGSSLSISGTCTQ